MYRIWLLIVLCFSSIGFAAPIKCPTSQCIAVVNAGNAGSRLHVYSYERDESNTPYKIKHIFSNKVESGIAACELNQKSINAYLSLLFSDEPSSNIPVYFYATSGMRKQSFARQQAYYNKLSHWFASSTHWQLAEVKTLTSKEEALYGWLAVNYELGTLNESSLPLVGVIDSGSASVQVAFPVKSTVHIAPKDYVHVSIYGRDVTLFTHGFLGLGQDEIRAQYLDHGVCFPMHYPLPNESLAAGNLFACEKFMPPLINDIHQVKETVQLVTKDNPNQKWYIIGGISAMLQEKPFTFDKYQFTSQELAEKANRQVCQQDWSVLGTLYPDNRHMYTSCINASYFHSLLMDGLGLHKNQPIHYLSNKVSTNDWTLGVVLLKSSP